MVSDNPTAGLPGLEDVGVVPTYFEDKALFWMRSYRIFWQTWDPTVRNTKLFYFAQSYFVSDSFPSARSSSDLRKVIYLRSKITPIITGWKKERYLQQHAGYRRDLLE